MKKGWSTELEFVIYKVSNTLDTLNMKQQRYENEMFLFIWIVLFLIR